MITKNITIAGKEVTLAYCYATEIAFRKYTDVSIDSFDATNPEHVLYLILATIMAWCQSKGEQPTIKDEEIMFSAKPKEIVDALTAIFEMRKEWYYIPDPETPDTKEETDKKPADKKND